MSAEILDHQPAHYNPEEQTLEELLLAILEQHDGLCLDNKQERTSLATVLATALMAPDPLPQTAGSSVSPPPAE